MFVLEREKEIEKEENQPLIQPKLRAPAQQPMPRPARRLNQQLAYRRQGWPACQRQRSLSSELKPPRRLDPTCSEPTRATSQHPLAQQRRGPRIRGRSMRSAPHRDPNSLSPPQSNNRARSAEIPGGPSIRGTTPQDHLSRFINGAPHPLNPSLPSQASSRS